MVKYRLLFGVATLFLVGFLTVDTYSSTPKTENDTQEVSSVQEMQWAEYEAAHEAALKEANKFAYLDIESASPELKQKILDARSTIIYSSSWVADDVFGWKWDKDGVTEELPKFSEIFPDWDMPVVDIVFP